MRGFEVSTENLQRAAGARQEAAEEAEGFSVGAALGDLCPGLPGSQSAQRVTEAAESWDARTGSLADALRQQAEKLSEAAEHYEAFERSAADDLARYDLPGPLA